MPKFIGNRVGAAVTHGNINQSSNASGIAKGGVFNIFDQYYFARVERWTGLQVGQQDVTPRLSSTGLATPTFSGGTPGGTYQYFIWTGPGSFTLSPGPDISVEYVVIGGGGGGGRANVSGSYNNGAGGGAGGFRTGTASVATGTTPITIGPGGVPAASGPTTPIKPSGRNGENGVPTVWTGLITSEGGGGGGGGAPGLGFANGRSGGCGGGGGGYAEGTIGLGNRVVDPNNANPPPSATPAPAQGNNGGDGGGGGGGAGISANGGTGPGGAGGAGVRAFSGDTNIPASFGTPGPLAGRWFCGGGGGGNPGAPGGPGGFGGGGTGGGITPQEGGAATGHGAGGGGASRDPNPTNRGGSGSGGIVILRVLQTQPF